MRVATLIFLFLATIAVSGPALAHEEALAGGEWVLATAHGPQERVLRFEAGRVSGTGGCNRFGGRYEQDGSTLIFAPLAATRMACAPDVMREEQAFFAMLRKVRHLDIKDGTLTMLDAAGGPLASFKRRGAD